MAYDLRSRCQSFLAQSFPMYYSKPVGLGVVKPTRAGIEPIFSVPLAWACQLAGHDSPLRIMIFLLERSPNPQNLSITLFITAVVEEDCRVKLANRQHSGQKKLRPNSYLQIYCLSLDESDEGRAIGNQGERVKRARSLNFGDTMTFDNWSLRTWRRCDMPAPRLRRAHARLRQ